MAAVKSPSGAVSWLDNSFGSAVVKSANVSHSVKRNHCSALPSGQIKAAKLHSVTQKDCVNSISVGRHQQVSKKCSSSGGRQISPSNADEDNDTKVINQSCSRGGFRKLAVDVTDNVYSYSTQDQLLVFVYIC